MSRWSCGQFTHYLSLCHVLFTQVSVLQNANWASGANGVPVWRRTKHVGLEKDHSLGFAGPFCRSTAQTPPRPLYPHRPVLRRQREGSALWPKRPVWEVNKNTPEVQKTLTLRSKLHTVGRSKSKSDNIQISDEHEINSMCFMKCLQQLIWWLMEPLLNIPRPVFLPVCLWPTACWLGLVWLSSQKDTEYLDFSACKQ